MSLFTHMSVDSYVRFGLGVFLCALFTAATCCCAIILKRQLFDPRPAAEDEPDFSRRMAIRMDEAAKVPYWVLTYCLLAGPAVFTYMNALFVYEETLKQAGLL